MTKSSSVRTWLPWAAGYAAVWAAAVYVRMQSGDFTDALASGVIFALLLPPVVWAFTRKTAPAAIPVARPGRELGAVLVWLAIYAVVCLGWLFTAIKQTWTPGSQSFELVMLAVKLLIHVAIPILVLKLVGAKVLPLLAPRMGAKGVWPLLVILTVIFTGLMCVISPALKEISGLDVAPSVFLWAAPGAFVWMALEAGLTEEFLFRAVLQTRLAAFMKSEAGAIVIGALLFALAHVPGLYLRPDTSSDAITGLPQIIAYCVGVLSPIAILFGIIWARTRSLGLLIILHATVDFLPNLSEFVRTWA
jgi:membrane protease YdiL (CAAX protease family)